MHAPRYITAGFNAGSTQGQNIASTTVNVKGSWVELTASLADDIIGFWLHHSSGAGGTLLVDVAIGASGQERVILSNLLVQRRAGFGATFYVPLSIPAGSRVAARQQAVANAGNGSLLYLLGVVPCERLTHRGYQACETYGADTSDSSGTLVDAGGTANTKGAWVEITSSSAQIIRALMPVYSNNGDETWNSARWLLDIGIGAAGSERVIVPDLHVGVDGTGDALLDHYEGPFPVLIPASTRIAARCACNVTTANNREVDLALYGFR